MARPALLQDLHPESLFRTQSYSPICIGEAITTNAHPNSGGGGDLLAESADIFQHVLFHLPRILRPPPLSAKVPRFLCLRPQITI